MRGIGIFWLLAVLVSMSSLAKHPTQKLVDPLLPGFLTSLHEETPEQARYKLDEFAKHLRITEQQQEVWLRFKIAYLEALENGQLRLEQLQQLSKEKRNHFTSIESLQIQQHLLTQRLKETENSLKVTELLYNQLDEQQKKLFDHTMRYLWFNQSAAKRIDRIF